MKFFISSTVLSLLTIQVFLSCNCQIILFPFNEVINFNPSNATYKILKSSDFTNFKTFQSIFLLGKSSYSSITANLPLVYASSLAKAVIRDSAQNDLKKIMKALNAVATSLAGCIPETSYQNELNVTTACFLADCLNTPVKCQALYIQIVISELMLSINAAASNLNLTSSILVGNGWNFQSLSSVTTQWSIVQASAAGYQNSTTISPMIKRVNSNFKRVLSGALSGTTLFLNSFESGYKTLINSLSNTNYNQTIDDYAALVSLNAAFNADKSFSTDSFNFDGIVLKSSSTQFSLSGITATSFVRPAAIRVFDSLNDLSSSFNAELSRFQNNMQTIVQIQANAYPTSFKASSFSTKEDIKAVSDVLNSVILSSSMQNQNSKTEISKLITNYTNLINSFTNMTIDCFKVACADNIIYPYSLWNLQCVNDNSFTSFCWNEEIPRTVQRCPSTKAETLNACLDDVASMISSLQPSSDFETILEDASSSTIELKSSYQSFLTSKNLN